MNTEKNNITSMFDEPINMEQEDKSFDIPLADDFSIPTETSIDDEPNDENEKNKENEEEEEGEKELSFEELEEKPKTDEDEEKLIASLKEKGYDVSKKEEPKSETLEQINTVIEQATAFIEQDNFSIVKEKSKSDLIAQYKDSGKQHLINSEEFEIDLEATLSQYEDNETLTKLYADNIRRDVKDLLNKKISLKNEIISEEENKIKQSQEERKAKLQDSIRAISKSSIFGLDINSESALEIYKNITSGEFTKKVNSSPELVAEFATYIKYREEITKKLGGPTYGEGVKDIIDAIDNSEDKSKNPLGKVIKKSQSNRNSLDNSRVNSWLAEEVDVKEEKETKKVAGRGNAWL